MSSAIGKIMKQSVAMRKYRPVWSVREQVALIQMKTGLAPPIQLRQHTYTEIDREKFPYSWQEIAQKLNRS